MRGTVCSSRPRKGTLTECRYARTLYFPVLVGKHVSATNFVILSGSVAMGSFTSARTQGIAVGFLGSLRLPALRFVMHTESARCSSGPAQCRWLYKQSPCTCERALCGQCGRGAVPLVLHPALDVIRCACCSDCMSHCIWKAYCLTIITQQG